MTKQQLIEELRKVIVDFRNETGFEITGVDVKYNTVQSGQKTFTRQLKEIEVHVE